MRGVRLLLAVIAVLAAAIQAVLGARRVQAKGLIPVHWGLFRLAHHGWTEPAARWASAAHKPIAATTDGVHRVALPICVAASQPASERQK